MATSYHRGHRGATPPLKASGVTPGHRPLPAGPLPISEAAQQQRPSQRRTQQGTHKPPPHLLSLPLSGAHMERNAARAQGKKNPAANVGAQRAGQGRGGGAGVTGNSGTRAASVIAVVHATSHTSCC
jgi:hypothetical protein